MQVITTVRRALAVLSVSVLVLSSVWTLPFFDSKAAAAGFGQDGLAVSAQVSGTTVTSPVIKTTQANDLLVAFLNSDGPSTANSQAFTCNAGSGLTWTLRKRASAQAGVSEIWTAVAPTILTTATNATLKCTRTKSGYVASMTIAAFSGAAVGASAGASAASGAPSVSLTTTKAGSWVWGVGNDYDNAIARTVGAGQTKVKEYLATSGDTFWVQQQTAVTPTIGTVVAINDTTPTGDQWNLAALEITPAAPADTIPPTAPVLNTAVSNSPTTVDLQWTTSTDNVGVATYTVMRGAGSAPASYAQVGQPVNHPTAQFSDTTATANTLYSYKVTARDAAGNATDSNVQQVTTLPDTTAPSVPGTPTVSNITASSLKLTWSASTDNIGVTGYQVWRDSGAGAVALPDVITTPTFTDTGLTANTTYTYFVKAYDANSNYSGQSGSVSATTLNPDTIPPTAPTNLTAGTVTYNNVPLTWAAATDNVGVTQYNVLRGGVAIGTATGLSYNDTTVAASTTYTYTVTAQDAAGNVGPASNASTVTTPVAPVATAPSLDASSPAGPIAVDKDVPSVTSQTFTPPANTVIYAVFSMDSVAGSRGKIKDNGVTNTGTGTSLVWNRMAAENSDDQFTGGFVEVWWASCTASVNCGGVPIAVTAVFSQNTKNVPAPVGLFQIMVMKDAALNQVGANYTKAYTLDSNNTISVSVPVHANSRVYAVANIWDNSNTPTPATGQSVYQKVLNPTDRDGYWILALNQPIPAGGSLPVQMSATLSGSLTQWHVIGWEVLAAN